MSLKVIAGASKQRLLIILLVASQAIILPNFIMGAEEFSRASGQIGSIDTTFGTNGFNATTPGTDDYPGSVLVDASGRIVVGGTTRIAGSYGFLLARYNNNGTLDSSFGTNGFNTVTLGTNDSIYSIALDTSGRIIAGGSTTIGGVSTPTLARYLANGHLDNSFGTNGFSTISVGTSGYFLSIVIDASNRVLAGGQATIGGQGKLLLARFSVNGSLDNTFAINGVNTTSFGSSDSINSITLDHQGRIFAVGGTSIAGNPTFLATRYLASGALDTTFGTAGFNTATPGVNDTLWSAAVDSAGRYLAGGTQYNPTPSRGVIARYSSNGTLDASYGTSGFAKDNSLNVANFYAVALDGSDRVVAGGFSSTPSQPYAHFFLTRFNANGTIDSNFGASGGTWSALGTSDQIYALTLDGSNRIVVAGLSWIGATDVLTVGRYLGDPVVSAPAVQIPPPVQQSSISGIEPSVALVGSSAQVRISGKFFEQISNISVNDTFLHLGDWSQTSTSLIFAIPPLPVGTYSVQIYNGSAPLLSPQSFSFVESLPLSTPSSVPSTTPTPSSVPSTTSTPTSVPAITQTPDPAPTPTPVPSASVALAKISKLKESKIYFKVGSPILSERDKEVLGALTSKLSKASLRTITIYGFADNQGTEQINKPLSRLRAQVVANFLKASLNFSGITTVGKGSIPSVNPNQRKNRRVDIYITYSR